MNSIKTRIRMGNIKMKRIIKAAAVLAALLAGACTQNPSHVTNKGEMFFGREGRQMAGTDTYREQYSVGYHDSAPAGRIESRELPPVKASVQPLIQSRPLSMNHEVQSKPLAPLKVAAALPVTLPDKPEAPASSRQDWAKQAATSTPRIGMSAAPGGDSASAARPRFIWPVRGEVISGFGPKNGGERNDGINIAAPEGEPIFAAAGGQVVYAGNELPGYGNMVILRHEGGWKTAYAHAGSLAVKKNDRVRQGDLIAYVGTSGGVKTAQLHFGVREGTKPVNPVDYMARDVAVLN